jgi:hypothetical protein
MCVHTCGEGRGKDKVSHKNAIKHEKRQLFPYFLTTPITPKKEFGQNPQKNSSVFQFLFIYECNLA